VAGKITTAEDAEDAKKNLSTTEERRTQNRNDSSRRREAVMAGREDQNANQKLERSLK